MAFIGAIILLICLYVIIFCPDEEGPDIFDDWD